MNTCDPSVSVLVSSDGARMSGNQRSFQIGMSVNTATVAIAGRTSAVAIAGAMRPQDHRFGLSALTIGRITARAEPAAARRQFQTAYDQFTRQFGRNDIRAAHVALHLALFSLRDGQLANAIALTNRHIPSARKAENAVVLSGLLAIKAEALRAAGRDTEARTARLSSLAWARYAFGDQDGDIARAQQQIADFSPTQP